MDILDVIELEIEVTRVCHDEKKGECVVIIAGPIG